MTHRRQNPPRRTPVWDLIPARLHTGFHPLKDVDKFRSFVPPIVQSMTLSVRVFRRISGLYLRTQQDPNYQRAGSAFGSSGRRRIGCDGRFRFPGFVQPDFYDCAAPGDNIVTTLNTFGEGYKQAATIFPERCGVEFRFVKDPSKPDAWAEMIDKRTKLVWIETPSNPTLFVTDIAAVADVAHAHGVPVLVDNTTGYRRASKADGNGRGYRDAVAHKILDRQRHRIGAAW